MNASLKHEHEEHEKPQVSIELKTGDAVDVRFSLDDDEEWRLKFEKK